HIRSGQYMASHSILPPRVDVFSHSANGLSWTNLQWMFDLVVAGMYGIGGAGLLTIVKALLAGLIFGLIVHITRKGVPTWWGTVCAGLALLAAYSQFTARPEIVTLVATTLLIYLLYRWSERAKANLLWLAVPLVWLWA